MTAPSSSATTTKTNIILIIVRGITDVISVVFTTHGTITGIMTRGTMAPDFLSASASATASVDTTIRSFTATIRSFTVSGILRFMPTAPSTTEASTGGAISARTATGDTTAPGCTSPIGTTSREAARRAAGGTWPITTGAPRAPQLLRAAL